MYFRNPRACAARLDEVVECGQQMFPDHRRLSQHGQVVRSVLTGKAVRLSVDYQGRSGLPHAVSLSLSAEATLSTEEALSADEALSAEDTSSDNSFSTRTR